jgi:hypothetical protein
MHKHRVKSGIRSSSNKKWNTLYIRSTLKTVDAPWLNGLKPKEIALAIILDFQMEK